MLKYAPLSNGFMVTSILGFLVSAILYSSGRVSASWGFTFCMMFVIMFLASVISMTHAPVPDELQIDMRRKRAEDAKKGRKP